MQSSPDHEGATIGNGMKWGDIGQYVAMVRPGSVLWGAELSVEL
jgi:hypothetical protein